MNVTDFTFHKHSFEKKGFGTEDEMCVCLCVCVCVCEYCVTEGDVQK